MANKAQKPKSAAVTHPEKYSEPTVLVDMGSSRIVQPVAGDHESPAEVVTEQELWAAVRRDEDDAKASAEAAQAAALAAHDEKATETIVGLSLDMGFDEFVLALQMQGRGDLAEQLINQKTESDRWQAHEEAIEAGRVELTAEIVEPGSDEDPFTATEPYFHTYTVADVRDLVIGALEGKAQGWEDEAYAESNRGAGSPATVSTLRWAAGQLRAIAVVVKTLEAGEWREPLDSGNVPAVE